MNDYVIQSDPVIVQHFARLLSVCGWVDHNGAYYMPVPPGCQGKFSFSTPGPAFRPFFVPPGVCFLLSLSLSFSFFFYPLRGLTFRLREK